MSEAVTDARDCRSECETIASSETASGGSGYRLRCVGETSFGIMANCEDRQLRREADASSPVVALGEYCEPERETRASF
ncbi:unnamed protein product [Echinostoma caproni]|uniref:SUEL-type lectin domain-containing protein n=1 Tax=Echinostoma caproni TaxID=27848 RepID=A0A183B364_9TREM|nr:unnamed protein product [Echinostoma caproni]